MADTQGPRLVTPATSDGVDVAAADATRDYFEVNIC